MSDEHTRTGAWLVSGRTLADLAGERCLVKPSRAMEMPLLQFRVVEVSPSKAYVRVAGSAPHEWLRVEDYTVIEVLEPWADNERALAQLHGLLGTADVRHLAALLGALRHFVPAEVRDSIGQACPKLDRMKPWVAREAELRTGAEIENEAAAARLKAELRTASGTAADALAAQGEKFHAFEWLRGEALKGNRPAGCLMEELVRLNRVTAELRTASGAAADGLSSEDCICPQPNCPIHGNPAGLAGEGAKP